MQRNFLLMFVLSFAAAMCAADNVPGLSHPKDLQSTVVSRFPDVRNCSAIDIDADGRIFVAEVGRFLAGVDDARRRREWIHEDMALQSPAERLAMYNRFADKWPMDYYTANQDRVVELRDLDGDGIYEKQTVFADGFNKPLDGLGSGLFNWEGKVYYSCIPNIWRMEDQNDDGVADKREVMQTGFGVRVSILGHDLNGLIWGPDGMLYGTVGDRGFNITTKEGRHFIDTVAGCIFRMNPDGSAFEVFYTRVRNPKAIAFDRFGKLFIVDNDGNLGDQCTMTYIIEGGEKGWHGGHQVLGNFQTDVKLPVSAVPPWTADRLWSPEGVMQTTAGHLPSGGNTRGGPGGMRVYPGVGLGEQYEDCFFIANYLGDVGKSGVLKIKMIPDRGGYKLEKLENFSSGVGASDVCFGYDGKLYAVDFGGGWGSTNENGRVVAYANPSPQHPEAVKELPALMKAGFRDRDSGPLRQLLDHPDMRVRQQAQFALARKSDALDQFGDAIRSKNVVTRLHGVWGVGQLAKAGGDDRPANLLTTLLADPEEKVREQAAQALGLAGFQPAAPQLTKLLADSSDQVRCLAAIAIGKLKYTPARNDIYAMIRTNNNACAYVRHSGMMALLGTSTPEELLADAGTAGAPERLVIMMCLRRLRDPRVAIFLQDPDAFIQQDTVTAINDLNIEAAVPQVAELLDDALSGKMAAPRLTTWQRLINANYRSGRPADVDRLIRTALSKLPPTQMRIMAAQLLRQWNPGTNIDFSTGLSRPIPERSPELVKTAVATNSLPLAIIDGELQGEASKLLAAYQIEGHPDALMAILQDPKSDATGRTQVFHALLQSAHPPVLTNLATYIEDTNFRVACLALAAMAKTDPAKAAAAMIAKMEASSSSVPLKQELIRTMVNARLQTTDDYLLAAMDRLTAGKLEPAIQLDLIEALNSRRRQQPIRAKLDAYRKSLDAKDPLAEYRIALAGGDPKAGYEVFHTSGTSLCLQCHLIGGDTPTAGPNLAFIGDRATPDYLLRALVMPSADLAPGYAPTVVTMKDGTNKIGLFMAATETTVSIKEGDAVNTYPLADITGYTPPISSMPPMGQTLPISELRDLIAYLSSQKATTEQKQ